MPPCLVCGKVTKGGPRCKQHEASHGPRSFRDDPRERQICAAIILEHIRSHGLWCPGADGHEPHWVERRADLSIDHDPPLSVVQDLSKWQGDRNVLCRKWNRAKGNRA